jgi:hypothetical protein
MSKQKRACGYSYLGVVVTDREGREHTEGNMKPFGVNVEGRAVVVFDRSGGGVKSEQMLTLARELAQLEHARSQLRQPEEPKVERKQQRENGPEHSL